MHCNMNMLVNVLVMGCVYFHYVGGRLSLLSSWVPGALTLGVKWLGREADHSPPSSAEVKECVGLYLHSPVCLDGMVLN
jgi:hypothetical protein